MKLGPEWINTYTAHLKQWHEHICLAYQRQDLSQVIFSLVRGAWLPLFMWNNIEKNILSFISQNVQNKWQNFAVTLDSAILVYWKSFWFFNRARQQHSHNAINPGLLKIVLGQFQILYHWRSKSGDYRITKHFCKRERRKYQGFIMVAERYLITLAVHIHYKNKSSPSLVIWPYHCWLPVRLWAYV